MKTYLEMLQRRINNEKGAEIVEWVLWVGGIAILAGTLYTVVSGALTTTVTKIVGGVLDGAAKRDRGAIVERMGERDLGLDPLEAVLLERQLAEVR